MPRSSRYAPSPEPQRRRRPPPKDESRRMWEGRTGKPPHPDLVTPALRAMRVRWYAQNPWRSDWNAHWEALKGARACFLERGSA